MNYFEVYDAKTGKCLAKGNNHECRKALGCSSLETFYALAYRSLRGINKKYKVVIRKGSETAYPILGREDPALYGLSPDRIDEILNKKSFNVGDTVFVIARCSGIRRDVNGCAFADDPDSCPLVKGMQCDAERVAIFEDQIVDIQYVMDGVTITDIRFSLRTVATPEGDSVHHTYRDAERYVR